MDQVQVEVVEAEALQRGAERLLGVLLAGVLHPQLGGDEQLPAGDAAGGDGAADGCLVAVRGGGVEVAVAGGQCAGDGLLGFLGGDLEHAEAEDRHLGAVVEGDGGDLDRHGGPSSRGCWAGAPLRGGLSARWEALSADSTKPLLAHLRE